MDVYSHLKGTRVSRVDYVREHVTKHVTTRREKGGEKKKKRKRFIDYINILLLSQAPVSYLQSKNGTNTHAGGCLDI